MATRVQIISNAITQLGKKPILSLTGQGDIVTAADQAFDMLLSAALSEGMWRFATKIQQLSQLNSTPIVFDWLYEYQIPSDFLKTVRMYPHNYAYEQYGTVFYSNVTGPLYLEYIALVNETLLPAYFVKYFVYELAAYLALSSAQNADFFKVIEARRVIELAIAQAADAQNRPQTPLQSMPIISNRNIGIGYL
jgi:hypothetical protein